MYVNLLFWYQFVCGFSGSTMTNSWVLIFFNLLFTSIPPLIYGVLDKDVSAETLLELPDLYKSGQNSQVVIRSHTSFCTLPFCCVQLMSCFALCFKWYEYNDGLFVVLWCVFSGLSSINVLADHSRCVLPKPSVFLRTLLCKSFWSSSLYWVFLIWIEFFWFVPKWHLRSWLWPKTKSVERFLNAHLNRTPPHTFF